MAQHYSKSLLRLSMSCLNSFLVLLAMATAVTMNDEALIDGSVLYNCMQNGLKRTNEDTNSPFLRVELKIIEKVWFWCHKFYYLPFKNIIMCFKFIRNCTSNHLTAFRQQYESGLSSISLAFATRSSAGYIITTVRRTWVPLLFSPVRWLGSVSLQNRRPTLMINANELKYDETFLCVSHLENTNSLFSVIRF